MPDDERPLGAFGFLVRPVGAFGARYEDVAQPLKIHP